uniref:Potassium channel toxin meuK1 n=1 Tax=Mesobuthus eupeus TaxID=34648 RepID=A0A143MGI3_MESEU|nr:potassium channel toxin meuK1 [Mesobuthus eupeus]
MKFLIILVVLSIVFREMIYSCEATNGVPGKCKTPGGCSTYCRDTTGTMGFCKKSKCYCAKY